MAVLEILENLDDVDDSEKDSYTQNEDGSFQRDVDVNGLKSALDAERDRAKEDSKRFKDLQKQFEGIDPVKYKEILAKAEKDEKERLEKEEQSLLDKGKNEEVFNKRLAVRDAGWQKQVDELQDIGKVDKERIATLRYNSFHDKITAQVASLVKHEGLVRDVTNLALDVFTNTEDDKIVKMDGDVVQLGVDGKTPLTIAEWWAVEKDKPVNQHLIVSSSSGSGAYQTSQDASNKRFEGLNAVDRITEARKKTAV
jgi:hypothetical protein